ncbi:MAG: PorP/SprF family type IX secretion system membrane protein, partial [Bacteroidota bacterium]
CIAVLLGLALNTYAQEPNFSMYQYTPFFTNPGQIGLEENIGIMLNYRNQAIDVGDNFTTSSASLYYPININKHRLVIAGNFLNDQISNLAKTNGGLLGLAYSIRTSATSQFSLGLQAGYFQRNIDNNFTTDDQFVNGVFDPNVVSSDAVLNQNTSYPTISGGLFYQISDERHREKAFLGASIFNALEPNISFAEISDDNLPLSIKGTAGYRIYQGMNFSILPNIRWINMSGNNFFNLGSRFGYELSNSEEGVKKIELGLWYNTNDLGVFSIAYEQPSFTFGVSYDTPIGDNLNVGQNGIFELALSIRLKRKSKVYRTAQEPKEPNTELASIEEKKEENAIIIDQVEEEKIDEPIVEEPIEETIITPITEEVVKETLVTSAVKQVLKPEEKKILAKTVRFKLNSDELDDNSKSFLNEVTNVLTENEWLKVELVGHTCDLGSEQSNDKLSFKRAVQVSKYLQNRGIDESRFIIIEKGEKEPLDNTQTEAARIKNRRVEFRVIE